MSLPKPTRSKYESEYAQLTDGDLHEVLLEFVKEEEKVYEGHAREVMVFRVLKERQRGGSEVVFNPPKVFETSAVEFCDLAVKAADNGQPAFWINAQYDARRKRWNLVPSLQNPVIVDPEVVRSATKNV